MRVEARGSDRGRRIRIALLTNEFDPFHGGIGAYARELATSAAAAGHVVTVLAPDYGRDCRDLDASWPFRVVRYPGGPAQMKGVAGRTVATRRLLRGERFDVVHAIDWPLFIPARLSTGLQPHARFLLTVHGTEIGYMRGWRRRLPLRAIGFWRRGWASWVANSRYTADLLVASLPVDRGDVRAIPLGVSERWRAGRAPRAAARAEFGLDEDARVILSLGRVVPRKGHATIAEALALLPDATARRIRWWVIGPLQEQDHAERLRRLTAPLRAEVEFLGARSDDEVRRRLSAADLFCLPGYRDDAGRVEGFGLVFLEAGAYGVPSIATLSGGIPEAVEDGVTGLLVPEHAPDRLADAIGRLAGDDALRRELGAAAQRKADDATWARVAEQTYGV